MNQKRGGGTWIYLGTFEFGKGACVVTLDNSGKNGETVTADAVKIGGGMDRVPTILSFCMLPASE